MALQVTDNMEELLYEMLSNAPAVVVLIYLVYRLDGRLQELQGCLIELLIDKDT